MQSSPEQLLTNRRLLNFMNTITNLTHHLLEQHNHSSASRDLAEILNQLALAGKIISRDINKAGLVDILGSTGKINPQNEEMQKLDEYANTLFIEILRQIPHIRAVGSEELPEIISFDEHKATGQYIVLFDPLDGSSNIDVNVSVGTIFSIFKKKSKGFDLEKSDYLQPGKNLVAAGYLLYGSSTMLVYSASKGVHGFTLDPSIGEFLLSHPHIKVPQEATYYTINESYSPTWEQKTHDLVTSLKKQKLNARYVAAMVADCHRNLLKGGLFIFPATSKYPQGKIRLMYEAIPFTYIYTQAGGYGSNGEQDILQIQPQTLHQRTPVFIGNTELL